jgi:hypothetical protein
MRRSIFPAVTLFALGASSAIAYTPPDGYLKTGQEFPCSAFAFGPGGSLALAQDNPAGGAVISLYPSLDAASAGEASLTLSDPAWKYIAGMQFADSQTLIFGENGDRDAVFTADLVTGQFSLLAPVNHLNDLAVRGSFVYAVAAGGPGANDLLRIALGDGSDSTVISGFGTGYGGGVAFDSAGNVLLTDTNDPFFMGNPGMIRRFAPDFSPLSPIDLSPGGGSGAYDLVFDAEGDLFVTTGSTLTLVRFSQDEPIVSPFGSFGGLFPFPTSLGFAGDQFEPGRGNGILLVGGFTDEIMGGAFAIAPAIPEPGTLSLLAGAMLLLARTRKAGGR